MNFKPYKYNLPDLIHAEFDGKICENADMPPLIRHYPVELAYALALIGTADNASITPPWLLRNFPKIMMRDFERVNPTKYQSDLDELIKESNYEDFYADEKEAILISTIHKAKGREFDTVYMLLNGRFMETDENMRKLYVGMTRAKNALYIHCNSELFSMDTVPGVTYTDDGTVYGEPNELTLQLTHKDVVLDFFRDKKDAILGLHSGIVLSVKENYLCAEINGQNVRVAKFSKACRERLQRLQDKGYHPCSAVVRFVVAWKNKEDEKEIAVLLPDLFLRRC